MSNYVKKIGHAFVVTPSEYRIMLFTPVKWPYNCVKSIFTFQARSVSQILIHILFITKMVSNNI